MEFSLIIPAFIAGLLTFLAPCTLPLVPAYLAFISGSTTADPEHIAHLKRRALLNGLCYVIGFTTVFMTLGTVFAFAGGSIVDARIWLTRIGGLFIIFFGLYMIGIFQLPFFAFLSREKRFHIAQHLTPGTPVSSLIFGASFAFGWTPCIGPLLGTILILAASTTAAAQGTFLLLIFSLGLALPFLLMAAFIGHAATYIKHLTPYLQYISVAGGLFLIFIGTLLLTDNLGLWVHWFTLIVGDPTYERFLDYL